MTGINYVECHMTFRAHIVISPPCYTPIHTLNLDCFFAFSFSAVASTETHYNLGQSGWTGRRLWCVTAWQTNSIFFFTSFVCKQF